MQSGKWSLTWSAAIEYVRSIHTAPFYILQLGMLHFLLQVLVGFWLTNAYSLYPTQSYVRNNELFGEQKIPGTTQYAYYEESGKIYLP